MWDEGFLTDPFDSGNFKTREFIIESLKGPGSRGKVSVTGSDILKKLDKERAKCPPVTDGELVSDIAKTSSPTTIDIVVSDNTVYDLKAGETEDYASIGDMVITYTGTTVITDGVRLTGVTWSAPSPYSTYREDAEAGDKVQRCRLFSGRVIDVFKELIEDYGGIDSAYIPFTDWETEYTTYLAGLEVERLIVEPEGVSDVLDELIEQSMTWGLWFDDVEQEIKYQAIRPIDIATTPAALTDDDNIVKDSIDIVDEPKRLINSISILYGQKNPTENKDEIGNYKLGILDTNLDSRSDRELGEVREKTIYARWHPAGNKSQVARLAKRILASRSSNLQRIEFEVTKKDSLKVAEFCDLNTIWLRGALGVKRDVRVQIIRADDAGESAEYVAREDFFTGNYARWAPGALSGLTYADATEEQRSKYLFWSDASGEMSNGDEGYVWL